MDNLQLITLFENQVYGENKLSIFKKRGIYAPATDFSMQFLDWEDLVNNFYIKHYHQPYSRYASPCLTENENKKILEQCNLYPYRKVIPYYLDTSTKTKICKNEGSASSCSCNEEKKYGFRLAIKLESLQDIPGSIMYASDGVVETLWGAYPQTMLSFFSREKELCYVISNRIFRNDRLSGNIYTDLLNCGKYEEYVNEYMDEYMEYVRWKNMFFKVEPIKWLIDEDEKIMVAEKIFAAPKHRLYGSILEYQELFQSKTAQKLNIKGQYISQKKEQNERILNLLNSVLELSEQSESQYSKIFEQAQPIQQDTKELIKKLG